MLLRPLWVASYSWSVIQLVLYCLGCILFEACLTWIVQLLFLRMVVHYLLQSRAKCPCWPQL